MNVVAKTKKHFKVQEEFQSFFDAWTAVIDSPTLEDYTNNLKDLEDNHKPIAVKYVVKTWLVWREKIVSFEGSMRPTIVNL
jgi:hypothetical protein